MTAPTGPRPGDPTTPRHVAPPASLPVPRDLAARRGAGGTEHIPVSPFDRILVAGCQGADPAGLRRLRKPGIDALAHGLAHPFDGMATGLTQSPGLVLNAALAYIAGCLHTMGP